MNIFFLWIVLLALVTSWPSSQINQVHPQTTYIWVQIKHNPRKYLFWKVLLRISLNSSLLTPLFFTIATFEINLFQAPERQYSSVDKVQVCKIFQWLFSPDSPTEWLTRFGHSVKVVSRKTVIRFPVLIWHADGSQKYLEKCLY